MPKRVKGLTPSERQKVLSKVTGIESNERPWYGKIADWMTEGITGDEPGPADLIMNFPPIKGLQAAIPFINKTLGKKLVMHGTPELDKIVKEGFNPDLYIKDDTLGWMTHFAEHPRYAEDFSNKLTGGGNEVRGLIPAEIDAKHALDMYNMEPDDLARIISSANPSDRKDLINRFKNYRQYGVNTRNMQTPVMEALQRFSPEQFRKTGFDAVRYEDFSQPSWAVPDPSQIIGKYSRERLGKTYPRLTSGYDEVPLPENKGVMLKGLSHTKPISHTGPTFHTGPGEYYTIYNPYTKISSFVFSSEQEARNYLRTLNSPIYQVQKIPKTK